MVQKGQIIDIYYNELEKPKSKIANPIHYWFDAILWLLFLSTCFFITRLLTKNCPATKGKSQLFSIALTAALFAPFIYGMTVNLITASEIERDQISEQSWPSWPEFERAVPKPAWWDSVAIKYFDPMDYTSEQYSNYVKKNNDKDKYHRQFKVTYALLLRHQNDPLQMGWDLAKGTTRQYMPMYEFFLSHYMRENWQGQCSSPCNDATQMVEMAGDLLSMKLDENQIVESSQLIQDIMKYKYSRGNNRGKYYFLYSYRRLLEHTHGKEHANQELNHLVEENLLEARQQNLTQQIKKWEKFWLGSQRKVGMFSHN
jgi:hypothetical protein